jgi:mono/diheme cytochrome c family protein
MKRQHAWAIVGLAAAIISRVPALAGDAEPAASPDDFSDPARAQRGKMTYAQHCSHCHGFNMVSAGSATYDLREFPRDQQQRFFESVTNGKNNRMPPWGDVLTQDEIGDVWAYVLRRGKL